LPRTPAEAILVVLVITLSVEGVSEAVLDPEQALTVSTAATATLRPGRRVSNSTTRR
jgi:hypothetical protein